MQHGSHHLARRLKSEPTTFDRFMLIVGTAAAFMVLPQIIAIWQNGAGSISIPSWAAFTVHSCLWVVYGIVHGERTVIWANTFWAGMNALVLVSALILR